MGYRIEYGPVKKVRGMEKRYSRRAALTALAFVLFFLFVNSFWQEGSEVMRNILLPGDSAVTAAALEDLTMDLRTGERVADALRDFCVQILEGAGIASNQ